MRGLRSTLRVVVSLGLLVVVAMVLEPREVVARLADMRGGWVLLALLLSVVQVGLSAWRWRFTARRLGLTLPLCSAVAEYYLATFLNQVLPGGVAGDVSRAWRHGRDEADGEARLSRPAVHAVVLERLSGQVVMMVVAAVSVAVLLPWTGPFLVVAAALAVAGTALLARRSGGAFRESLGRALLHPRALPVQLLTSLAVVATYLATYLVAARAVGMDTPALVLLPLVAPVLVSMLLPVTVAGWGVRETVAATLWGAVGLASADGVAISVAYGLLVLVSSAPGAVVLLAGRRLSRPGTAPGRRGRPSPGRSGGSGVAAPGPASAPPGG